ncbi:hypothetical protein [Ramlibacter sp.]|uniref:hypothetical protein n=1 Tax=Ramlibacter sp. TaxID=1917967 RepID=UPI002639C000|nr:hypothetical protein [Ramlibacter sp.]
MNSTSAIVRYCAFVACAVACATLFAVFLPRQEISGFGSAASPASQGEIQAAVPSRPWDR